MLRKPVTLQFRDANLRMVFEALSRTTGLNVIMDRDVRADLKTTIFVKDAALEDTVDLILLQSQLEKRSLNANTLFIYPATPAKQKEYQDLQIRTFQLANADAKYLQSVLKTVLKVKDVSVDDRTNTLVMRDTRDAIAVASKVIAAHDVPEPEVMLEVEVLEVSHDRLSNLGIKFPDSLQISTPSSAGTIGGLRDLTRNQLLVSPLGIGLNLKLEDTDANLLASPRIRARHKEKARIMIGDRVPIITNSVTPVQTGGSVVTGSVQYQDVGLKLEFEPQIYSAQEVGIKINLEVSNIVKEISDGSSGSLAYQIGTRNAQTSLRLRDGETQILAGLISDQDRNTSAKLPGLGHLPTVGKLFGNNSGTNNKSEIVLSITPRIIRPPVILEATLRDIFSGTESSLRENPLQLDPISLLRGQPGVGAAAARTCRRSEGSTPASAAPRTGRRPAGPGPGGAAAGGPPGIGFGGGAPTAVSHPVPRYRAAPPGGPRPYARTAGTGSAFDQTGRDLQAGAALPRRPRRPSKTPRPARRIGAGPRRAGTRRGPCTGREAAGRLASPPPKRLAVASPAAAGRRAAGDPELTWRGPAEPSRQRSEVALEASSLPRSGAAAGRALRPAGAALRWRRAGCPGETGRRHRRPPRARPDDRPARHRTELRPA